MSALIAFLLAAQATGQPANPAPRHPVISLFASACIDGQISLPPGTFRDLSYSDLPAVIRNRYPEIVPRQYADIRRWRFIEVMQPQRAYLLAGPAEHPRSYYDRICAVVAPDMNVISAYSAIWEIVWGRPPQGIIPGRTTYSFDNYPEGYAVYADNIHLDWVLMHLGHIGPGGRRYFEAAERESRRQAERRRRRGQPEVPR